jgi:hypothetical protein
MLQNICLVFELHRSLPLILTNHRCAQVDSFGWLLPLIFRSYCSLLVLICVGFIPSLPHFGNGLGFLQTSVWNWIAWVVSYLAIYDDFMKLQ